MGNEFAEWENRRRQMLERLADLPVVQITGIVSAYGSGGVRNPQENWDFLFDLVLWRVGSDPIRREELRVTRITTSREEFDSLRKSINADTIVQLRARLGVNTDDKPVALLEELLDPYDSDPALYAERDRLLKPITFDDPEFGEFRYDRRAMSFTGKPSWLSDSVELELEGKTLPDAQASLAIARSLWARQEEWDRRAREAAVNTLLALKNESWLNEGENEVTGEEFKAKMTLRSVVIRLNREFTFWYDDGDLFWGHAITIDGSLDDGPKNVGITG